MEVSSVAYSSLPRHSIKCTTEILLITSSWHIHLDADASIIVAQFHLNLLFLYWPGIPARNPRGSAATRVSLAARQKIPPRDTISSERIFAQT